MVELLEVFGDDLTVVNAARVSFAKQSDVLGEKDGKLIDYLAGHNHISPFFHPQARFRLKMPIFVAREWFRHQIGFARNEVSRRYIDTDPEFWIPEKLRKRDCNKKQGSKNEKVHHNSHLIKKVKAAQDKSSELYKYLLSREVCPEQARTVLPQSMFTEFIETGSLAAYARLYRLRYDPSAQYEIRVIAKKIGKLLKDKFPLSWAALTKCKEESDSESDKHSMHSDKSESMSHKSKSSHSESSSESEHKHSPCEHRRSHEDSHSESSSEYEEKPRYRKKLETDDRYEEYKYRRMIRKREKSEERKRLEKLKIHDKKEIEDRDIKRKSCDLLEILERRGEYRHRGGCPLHHERHSEKCERCKRFLLERDYHERRAAQLLRASERRDREFREREELQRQLTHEARERYEREEHERRERLRIENELYELEKHRSEEDFRRKEEKRLLERRERQREYDDARRVQLEQYGITRRIQMGTYLGHHSDEEKSCN